MYPSDAMAPPSGFRQDEAGRLLALHRLKAMDAAPEDAFENLVSLVKSVFNVPICAISLVDSDRQFFLAERGLDCRETARELSFCSHAITRPEPFLIHDARQDPRFANNPLVTGAPFICSYAGIPLVSEEGYHVGALCVIDREPRDYTPEQIALLTKFAASVMHQLELRVTACSDHLTMAMNRRGWMKVADAAFITAEATRTQVTVAIFDIDHFKAVNDAHGHAAGDDVLKAFAEICRTHLADGQRLGRIGGEEFALLLPGVGAQDALAAMEVLRAALGAATHALPEPVRCTASFGIAERDASDRNIDQLLSRADQALYAAKAGGRDRCVVAAPDAPRAQAARA